MAGLDNFGLFLGFVLYTIYIYVYAGLACWQISNTDMLIGLKSNIDQSIYNHGRVGKNLHGPKQQLMHYS